MRFGKRFAASFPDPEFARNSLDYKALKKLTKGLASGDEEALAEFDAVLQSELRKVDAFYSEREEELRATMAALSGKTCFSPAATGAGSGSGAESKRRALSPSLSRVRADARALQRFASLNYVAVLKAVKKRDRRLSEGGGGDAAAPAADAGAAPRPAALRALARTRFFSSTTLAALATAAEVAMAEESMRDLCSSEAAREGEARSDDGEFKCSVCLGLLSQPVVLSCGHRFCWGCAAATAGAAVAARHKRQQQDAEAVGRKKAKGVEGGRDATAAAATDATASAATDAPPQQRKPPLSPTSPVYWGCPVCRKPHALADASSSSRGRRSAAGVVGGFSLGLEVDENLERLVARLSRPPSPPKERRASDFLLPPLDEARHPRSTHPLTVVLDLDGTLIASYPPSRAGALLSPRGGGGAGGVAGKPPAAFLVGQGSELNPNGVLVLERPGLGEFLSKLSEFAEVVVFTAGLEGYASPIVSALEQRHGALSVPPTSHRLFRGSTTSSRSYPCVKDLSRLGRCPRRTVLIEDTALAGLAQPENVVPVMPWRAEMTDDRVLVEAVLPLLEELAVAASASSASRELLSASSSDGGFDVRSHLGKRFGLRSWFASQGVSCGDEAMERREAEEEPPSPSSSSTRALPPISEQGDESDGDASPPPQPPLFVSDFDHTLVDFDSAEEVVSLLAPELAPMLRAVRMPADFIPLTNAVAAEAERRGVGEGAWLDALREAGRRGLGGAGGAGVLRAAAAGGADVRILSDANDLFISEMLSAAGVSHRVGGEGEGDDAPPVVVGGVVTNRASFVPSGGGGDRKRLVVEPRHDASLRGRHGCPLCPSNLCKGLELTEIASGSPTSTAGEVESRAENRRRTVIYAGDGENDLCPALSLSSPGDSVLVRRGRGLERLLRERADGGKEAAPPRATAAKLQNPLLAKAFDASLSSALRGGASAFVWETAEELRSLVEALLLCCDGEN